MPKLMKDCVRFHPERRADRQICGELIIKRGLKRRARKRKLVIDHEMLEVLERLLKDSDCDHVFTKSARPNQASRALGAGRIDWPAIRKKLKTHPDAALHALRHTFLTEAGEYTDPFTDPFTLQYVARHDNIKTTTRYLYPQEAAVHKLFLDWRTCSSLRCTSNATRSVQNPVHLEMPSQADLAKFLIAGNLQNAEVVELADTPS
jgi:hypothetical protein